MTTMKDIGCVMDIFELPEADTEWNDEQRKIICEMQDKHGEAWLGDINRAKEERAESALWKWDGGLVYNFGADFVLPKYDEELDRLIRERESAGYTDAKSDMTRIETIIDRIKVLGGRHLIWT